MAIPCDPQSLMEAARCLTCLSAGEMDAAQLALMCSWANAVAGTPVVPVIPPFDPSSLGNLQGWFKADSLNLPNNTLVGDGVTTDWLDSSGNGHTMTQTSVPAEPAFQTNIFGTMPGIQMIGGTTVFLKTSPTSFNFPGDYTLFFAFKPNVISDNLLMGQDAINMQVRIARLGSNSAVSIYDGGTEVVCNNMTGVGVGVTPRCLVYRRTGVAVDFLFNNVVFPPTSGFTSNGNLFLNSLCKSIPSGVPCLNGWLGEVLLYSDFKSNADCTTIYNYLKTRWGLP